MKLTKQTGKQLLMSLLLAYILTFLLLLFLALLLYKAGLQEKAARAAITVIYALASLVAGHRCRKKAAEQKVFLGTFGGSGVFLYSRSPFFSFRRAGNRWGTLLFTTLFLCCGGGMLGGMLS